MKCADCGAEVEQTRDSKHWGERRDPPGGKGWDMCCRVVYDPADHTRILAADYHYVEGETQRTFRAP